jgi:diaminopimelate decarboxylase
MTDTSAEVSRRSAPWASGPPSGTPCAVFDLDGLDRRLHGCAAGAAARGITLAYSIKTNPMPAILRRARAAGLAAEAISGAEVTAAVNAGFRRDQIVLGGVAKSWPTGTVIPGLYAVLDDTLEGFAAAASASAGHRHHCVRLRFPGVGSRLGFDTTRPEQCQRLARALLDADTSGVSVGLATHQHYVPASLSGAWLTAIRSILDRLADADPGVLTVTECLDLGGGYDAACLDDMLWGDLGKALMEYVHDRLPRCRTVILEPGKSLVQAYGVVIGTVLACHPDNEVYVDASMAELPWPTSGRPLFVWRGGRWRQLTEGPGRIAGRCTAETDVLATSVDISGLSPGDKLLFAEAGAYDWSMRNTFGTATVVETTEDDNAPA